MNVWNKKIFILCFPQNSNGLFMTFGRLMLLYDIMSMVVKRASNRIVSLAIILSTASTANSRNSHMGGGNI